eukprot:scaffold58687_cov18-Tisochrysis_lutea.AAC.1
MATVMKTTFDLIQAHGMLVWNSVGMQRQRIKISYLPSLICLLKPPAGTLFGTSPSICSMLHGICVLAFVLIIAVLLSCPQKALKEIRVFQKTVDLLIPKRPFYRLVKEIMQSVGPPGS